MEDFSQVLIIPTFKNLDLSIFVSRPVLWIVLFLFFLVYAVLSGILIYHWQAYGMKSKGIIFAETLYLFVSVILFVLAGLGITYF